MKSQKSCYATNIKPNQERFLNRLKSLLAKEEMKLLEAMLNDVYQNNRIEYLNAIKESDFLTECIKKYFELKRSKRLHEGIVQYLPAIINLLTSLGIRPKSKRDNTLHRQIVLLPKKNNKYHQRTSERRLSCIEWEGDTYTNTQKLLGRGGYGSVYQFSSRNGKSLAVKYFFPEYQEDSKREAYFTKMVRGLNKANFFKIDNNQQRFVKEFVSGKLLKDELKQTKRLMRFFSLYYMLIEDLQVLHEKNIVHCDISIRNIIVSRFHMPENQHEFQGSIYKVELIDFGLSNFLDAEINFDFESEEKVVSTAVHAPELRSGSMRLAKFDQDIYSLGRLILGYSPRKIKNYSQLYGLISRAVDSNSLKRPSLGELKSALAACIDYEIKKKYINILADDKYRQVSDLIKQQMFENLKKALMYDDYFKYKSLITFYYQNQYIELASALRLMQNYLTINTQHLGYWHALAEEMDLFHITLKNNYIKANSIQSLSPLESLAADFLLGVANRPVYKSALDNKNNYSASATNIEQVNKLITESDILESIALCQGQKIGTSEIALFLCRENDVLKTYVQASGNYLVVQIVVDFVQQRKFVQIMEFEIKSLHTLYGNISYQFKNQNLLLDQQVYYLLIVSEDKINHPHFSAKQFSAALDSIDRIDFEQQLMGKALNYFSINNKQGFICVKEQNRPQVAFLCADTAQEISQLNHALRRSVDLQLLLKKFPDDNLLYLLTATHEIEPVDKAKTFLERGANVNRYFKIENLFATNICGNAFISMLVLSIISKNFRIAQLLIHYGANLDYSPHFVSVEQAYLDFYFVKMSIVNDSEYYKNNFIDYFSPHNLPLHAKSKRLLSSLPHKNEFEICLLFSGEFVEFVSKLNRINFLPTHLLLANQELVSCFNSIPYQKYNNLMISLEDLIKHNQLTLLENYFKFSNSQVKSVQKAELLNFSIFIRNHDALKLLIKLGVNLNSEYVYGNLPLHTAARYHWAEGIKTLLALTTDVNQLNKSGRTPLMLAVEKNEAEENNSLMIPYFAIKTNRSDKRWYKSSQNSQATYKLLIEAKSDIEFISSSAALIYRGLNKDMDMSALAIAVKHNNKMGIDTLLEYKADPNRGYPDGNVLHAAILERAEHSIIMRIAQEPSLVRNTSYKKLGTELHLAAAYSFELLFDLLKLYLIQNSNLGERARIIDEIKQSSLPLIDFIIDNIHANSNIRQVFKCLKLLIAVGADVDQKAIHYLNNYQAKLVSANISPELRARF